jgi:putative FmdB family regulatory protein
MAEDLAMPIYEYHCLEHGLFEEMRPMHRSSEGADCPLCAALSRRVLSATRTNLVPRAVSMAHARNEKSQHAPEVCTPGHHHHPTPKKAGRARQAQVYRGKRPWVMEHG